MARRVVQRNGAFAVRQRRCELALVMLGISDLLVSHGQELRRTLCLRHDQHLGCQLSPTLHLATIVVEACETKLGEAKPPGIAYGLAQNSRSLIRSPNFWVGIA